MRVDDWNDDPAEEPNSWEIAAPPAPPVTPDAARAAPEEPIPTAPPAKAALGATWPILLVGALSIGSICVMFFTIIYLIVSR